MAILPSHSDSVMATRPDGWSLLSLCFRDSVLVCVLMQCVSSTDAEEMDKMLFADSPQDAEEATVEKGSC